MLFSGHQGRIQASSGYIVPRGSEVRHQVDWVDDGMDGAIVTLVVSDAPGGGSELSIDMPASVVTDVITTLRDAIEEAREEHERHVLQDTAPYSEPG